MASLGHIDLNNAYMFIARDIVYWYETYCVEYVFNINNLMYNDNYMVMLLNNVKYPNVVRCCRYISIYREFISQPLTTEREQSILAHIAAGMIRQNGCYFFSKDIFNIIFVYKNCWLLIKIVLEFVSKGPINSKEALSSPGLNASIQKDLKNGFGLAANQKPGFKNSYLTNMDLWTLNNVK